MRNVLFLVPVLSTLIITSCNTISPGNSQTNDAVILKENELLKRELEIKQKEIELETRQKELNTQVKADAPISELYKHVKQGVFLVYAYGNNSISQGSGFFVNSSGIAVSNYHVFKNAKNGVVYTDNGQEFMITKIISSNEDQDYVIFKVGVDKNDFYPLRIAAGLPDIGEPCFAIGNPEGLTQTLSIGNISGYRDANGRSFIQTTAEITHGSSGGPLFNRQGEVIGITTMGKSEANLNFAISINKTPCSGFANITEQRNDTRIAPAESIKNIILSYYNSLSNRDYFNLQSFYSPVLDRYYTDFNITSAAAVSNAEIYWDKFKIVSAKNIINWNTFKVESLGDGCFNASFNMDYLIERVENNKAKKFNLDIVVLLTPELKIKSIYENIISAKK